MKCVLALDQGTSSSRATSFEDGGAVVAIRSFVGGAHMKKLINDPGDVVRESLAGFAAAHADILKVCFDPVYVVRADAPVAGKVGIISGGGRCPPHRQELHWRRDEF
jgi:hypothetical protein